jgi:hypothetical protein
LTVLLHIWSNGDGEEEEKEEENNCAYTYGISGRILAWRVDEHAFKSETDSSSRTPWGICV